MDSEVANYNSKATEANNLLLKLLKSGSFQQSIEQARELREKMQNSVSNSESKQQILLNQINMKTNNNPHLEKFMNKKKDTVKVTKERFAKFEDLAKGRLDTINFKTLHKVKINNEIEALFKFFYMFLYKEKESTFNTKEFVKIALKKNKEEFKTRLAKFTVKDIGSEGMERLHSVSD